MARHRVAMIGAGMASGPWLEALEELDCDVVSVATRRPERLERVRERFPGAHRCWPPEAALDEDGITLCLNLSPASNHLDGVRMAVDARIPIVLEKPLEVTFDRGVAAVEIARAAGIPLAVCFQYRYQEGARALKEVIEAGDLGPIRAMTLEVMWWRGKDYYSQEGRGTYARDGGGVLLTQAAHALDLVFWYRGLPSSVFARLGHGVFRDIETEDLAAAVLGYPDESFATVIATTGSRSAEEMKLRVLGVEGTAVLTGNRLELFGDEGPTGSRESPELADRISTTDPMSFPSRWHTSFLSATLDAFDSGTEPPIGGRESLGSLSLIDAMERSAREGRQVAPRPTDTPTTAEGESDDNHYSHSG